MHPLAGAVHVDIRRTALNVDVVCDAYHLPFGDESFTVVHASHILEHRVYDCGSDRI